MAEMPAVPNLTRVSLMDLITLTISECLPRTAVEQERHTNTWPGKITSARELQFVAGPLRCFSYP